MSRLKLLIIVSVSIPILAGLVWLFSGPAPGSPVITWGVNFSQMHAEALRLDWKKNYLALLDDLGVKNIKLLVQWDFIEGVKDKFYFNDVDWQLRQAAARHTNILYVVGIKTGHWPECHTPTWVDNLPAAQQQDQALEYVRQTVLRYKNNSAIRAWQVENEPFFEFGQCPEWYYDGGDFLKKEIALVKSIDPSRPIIVSDSGEQSLWFKSARAGDIVGTTLYRKVWISLTPKLGFYGTMWFPPRSYWLKAKLISLLFHKKVINVELQAEPWSSGFFYDTPLSEQEKTMDLGQFHNTVEFARGTGFDTFYFWGVEWWYWLKQTHGKAEIWDAARNLFSTS